MPTIKTLKRLFFPHKSIDVGKDVRKDVSEEPDLLNEYIEKFKQLINLYGDNQEIYKLKELLALGEFSNEEIRSKVLNFLRDVELPAFERAILLSNSILNDSQIKKQKRYDKLRTQIKDYESALPLSELHICIKNEIEALETADYVSFKKNYELEKKISLSAQRMLRRKKNALRHVRTFGIATLVFQLFTIIQLAQPAKDGLDRNIVIEYGTTPASFDYLQEDIADEARKTSLEKYKEMNLWKNEPLFKNDTNVEQHIVQLNKEQKFYSDFANNIEMHKRKLQLDIESIRNELIEHFSSKQYRDRLVSSLGRQDRALSYQKSIIDNLKSVSVIVVPNSHFRNTGVGAYYTPHKIVIPHLINDPRNERLYITHEMLHAAYLVTKYIPAADAKLLTRTFQEIAFDSGSFSLVDEDVKKMVKDLEEIHRKQEIYYSQLEERIVRKKAFEFEMEKLGIKKINEPFTLRHLELVKKRIREFSSDAINFIQRTSPEDLVVVMNQVAEQKKSTHGPIKNLTYDAKDRFA